jgi:hypothetical protein
MGGMGGVVPSVVRLRRTLSVPATRRLRTMRTGKRTPILRGGDIRGIPSVCVRMNRFARRWCCCEEL